MESTKETASLGRLGGAIGRGQFEAKIGEVGGVRWHGDKGNCSEIVKGTEREQWGILKVQMKKKEFQPLGRAEDRPERANKARWWISKIKKLFLMGEDLFVERVLLGSEKGLGSASLRKGNGKDRCLNQNPLVS